MVIDCRECGGKVSTEAAACPHCGAPTAQRPSDSGTKSKTRRRGIGGSALRIVGLVILIVAAFIAWKLARPGLEDVGVLKAPKWVVENAGGDDSCTRVGDFCMRTKCLVRNVGDDAGAVDVRAVLDEQGGRQVEKRTTLRLAPGQSETLTFDFFEAEMGRQYRYGCRVATASR